MLSQFIRKLNHDYKLCLVLLFFIFTACNSTAKMASYLLPDTRVFYGDYDTDNIKKGQPYFMYNWYEGLHSDTLYFSKTNWKPYAPKLKLAYYMLKEKKTENRLQKLIEDGYVTGFTFYLDITDKNQVQYINQLVKKYNYQFFIQTYTYQNRIIKPFGGVKNYLADLMDERNVEFYFNDDVFSENWNKTNAEASYHLLKKHKKKLLSACLIRDYWGKHSYLVDMADIIAPQIYPVSKRIEDYQNLDVEIPPFHELKTFHFNLIKGKELFSNQRFKNMEEKRYILTFPIYHTNEKPGSKIARYPYPEEARFMFFDAIICGVKGFNFFAFYRCSNEAYLMINDIIHEFKASGFEKAVLHGQYNPTIIDMQKLAINSDTYDIVGNKILDIDYCLYEYQNEYFLILSNNSVFTDKIEIKINKNQKKDWYEFRSENSKIYKKLLAENTDNCYLEIRPYDIKLIKIMRKE
mgnify:CR=1 FL=1